MRALVLKELKSPLSLEERDALEPVDGQAVIDIEFAALNRRDYWITQGMYPGIKLPVVLGSDGIGRVASVRSGAYSGWVGRRVVVNPGWDWGSNPLVQSDDFQILGMPVDGTLAQQVAVPAETIYACPDHLSDEEGAALPLAGVTAYRALFVQGRLTPERRVLITGIGGGVATTALQFALATGARVAVTSSSPEKRERACELGAESAYDYREEGWARRMLEEYGPPDLIVDSGGGDGYNDLAQAAAPGGTIVSYGATAGPPSKFDLFKVFWKQLHLVGSTMGSPEDFAAMLQFVQQHEIRPVVDDVFALEEGNEALECMRDSRQFGKIVVRTR